MKIVIFLLSVLVVIVMAIEPAPMSYEADDIIDYGDKIYRKSRKCSDEVLFAFQRTYPNLTEFLANTQLLRNFNTVSYNSCKRSMENGGPNCLEEWKVSVALTESGLSDEIVKILPLNGKSEFKRLIDETNKCIVRHE